MNYRDDASELVEHCRYHQILSVLASRSNRSVVVRCSNQVPAPACPPASTISTMSWDLHLAQQRFDLAHAFSCAFFSK